MHEAETAAPENVTRADFPPLRNVIGEQRNEDCLGRVARTDTGLAEAQYRRWCARSGSRLR